MRQRPWFRFWAADWASDAEIRMMTLAERGAYIDILVHAYCNDGLPSDETKIARLIGVSARDFRRVSPAIMPRLYKRPDGRLSHKRVEEERQHGRAQSERQSARRRGGKPNGG